MRGKGELGTQGFTEGVAKGDIPPKQHGPPRDEATTVYIAYTSLLYV